MANIQEPIKVGNFWTNLIDSATGASVEYEEVTTWYDGSPMDASKADGVVYRQLPSSVGGGFVKLVVLGDIPLSLFGIKQGIANAGFNVVALKKALSPVSDGGVPLTGRFVFPPGGTYYIDDFVDKVKRGTVIDLQGSTLIFSKTFAGSDNNKAIFRTLGDFEIHNGRVEMSYDRGGGVIGFTGALVRVGARFVSEFDDKPFQGNLRASNLNILCNSNVSIFSATGALNNVVIENVIADGADKCNALLQYEWGFITNEPNQADRTTGHASNIQINNCVFNNGSTTNAFASALVVRGAYNVSVRNLKVKNARLAIDLSPGEAAYFRTEEDSRIKGANLLVKGLVAEDMWGSGIAIGATVGPGSYTWDSGQMSPEDAVDLCSHTIEDFVIVGTPTSSYCITGDSRNLVLRNGKISGFIRGMFIAPETPEFIVDNVDISECSDRAIYFHNTTPIITPTRLKRGVLSNSKFSKIGLATPASIIQLTNCQGVEVSNNLFDATSGNCISAITTDATVHNLLSKNNRATGSFAEEVYVYGSATDRGNILENPSGLMTYRGLWRLTNPFVGNTTITVGPGGMFSTINAALSWLSSNRKVYESNVGYVRVSLTSGFVMLEQVLLRWGQDLGWVEIIAEGGAEITIDRASLTQGLSGTSAYLAAFGADSFSRLPKINCVFNMNTTGTATNKHGVLVSRGSTVEVSANSGVKNCGAVGLYVQNGGNAVANNSIFTGAGGSGVYCVGGQVDVRNANLQKGGTTDPLDIRVSAGGIVRATGATGGTSETPNTITASGIIFQ